MSEIPHTHPEGRNVRSDVFADDDFDETVLSIFNSIWWSQTGSNRRPHACKARALPAELWPRTRTRMLYVGCSETHLFQEISRSIKVVGLGRLELPTSRLSSARSNQLSYRPYQVSGIRYQLKFLFLIPDGAIAQLGERVLCKHEVVGSNPIGSTN